jgi:hypothetical protein
MVVLTAKERVGMVSVKESLMAHSMAVQSAVQTAAPKVLTMEQASLWKACR